MQIHLAKFLLLVMTILSIVMPIHAYAHEMTETQESYSIEVNTQHNTDSEPISCDHCCHFSSHSQGLTRIYSKIAALQNNYVPNFQRQNYFSIKNPPPYRPPIA